MAKRKPPTIPVHMRDLGPGDIAIVEHQIQVTHRFPTAWLARLVSESGGEYRDCSEPFVLDDETTKLIERVRDNRQRASTVGGEVDPLKGDPA